MSTNWLEHFHPADRGIQIDGVRQTLLAKGFRAARTGHFLVLNVGAAIDRCRQGLSVEIRFINLGDWHDPSHTGIYGLADNPEDVAQELAQSVPPTEIHPAA